MVTGKQRWIGILAIVGLLLAGCGNMREQPRLSEPYDPSPLFGTAARELDPNAVAIGNLQDDAFLYEGIVDGEYVDAFPFEITQEWMERGQVTYDAYCTPCHGVSGYGDGIVVEEGMQEIRSFHDPELDGEPVGYYFDAFAADEVVHGMTSTLDVADRWAVVAYIRALQLSQNANLDDLPQDIQDEFNAQTSQ